MADKWGKWIDWHGIIAPDENDPTGILRDTRKAKAKLLDAALRAVVTKNEDGDGRKDNEE